ncbi:MAG: hypothetical protein IT230_03570 [Flavobacteriales bacterium]|nr:hypothetical protein [Flavobacteriales bacterium]
MRPWLLFTLLLPALPLTAQQNGPLPAGKTAGQRIQLIGSVTDQLTGKPVYDCLVGYYNADGKRLMVTPVNSDGQYALFIPDRLPFELRVEQENGYLDLHRQVMALPEGDPQPRIDLHLQPR